MTRAKLGAIAFMAVTGLVASACSARHSAHQAAVGPPTVLVGPDAPPPTPAATLRAALAAMLTAERRGDHVTSFQLLSDEARSTYPDIHRWTDRRNELPAVTGFQLEGGAASAGSLTAIVDHTPSLDPFRGLSAARDRQVWQGRQEHGGWVLDADPAVSLILPSDASAPAGALAWADAAETCNTAGARARQAIDPLLGMAWLRDQLCGRAGALHVGAPHAVADGSASQDLIAQYSSASLSWARAVTIIGADHPFDAVLAPIGDEWQVVGIYAGT